MGYEGASRGFLWSKWWNFHLPTMTTPSLSGHDSLMVSMEDMFDENSVKNPNIGYTEDTGAAPKKQLLAVF